MGPREGGSLGWTAGGLVQAALWLQNGVKQTA